MRDAYLRDADLREADMSGADLCGVCLNGAVLSKANLSRTNLEDALSLKDTVLRGVIRIDKRAISSLQSQRRYHR